MRSYEGSLSLFLHCQAIPSPALQMSIAQVCHIIVTYSKWMNQQQLGVRSPAHHQLLPVRNLTLMSHTMAMVQMMHQAVRNRDHLTVGRQ